MSGATWRGLLFERGRWSLGLAAIWTWGLFLARLPRDGLLPLEVWFSYGLSFLMTAVYVYLGLLIYGALRGWEVPAGLARTAARARRPVMLLGWAGLAVALGSIGGWLALRYPGPAAVPGTISSVVLALMILGVVAVSTVLASRTDGG